MAHVAGREPAGVAGAKVDRGDVIVPRRSPLPARILELQTLVGNRAVTAMLSRWPVTVVLDTESASLMVEYDEGLYNMPHGTALEVLEPLQRRNEFVRARHGEYMCWIDLLSLKPDDPGGPLGAAIGEALGGRMLHELRRSSLLQKLRTAVASLAQSTGPATVGAEIEAVRAALVPLDNEHNELKHRAAARGGVPVALPGEITQIEQEARTLMQESGVWNAAETLWAMGASAETAAHYRKLRDVLEYPLFRGLAADPEVAFWLAAYEDAVEDAIKGVPLAIEPKPVLKGGKRLMYKPPTIGPGSAYQTEDDETVPAPASTGAGQVGGVVAGPVIAEQNPWAEEVSGAPIVAHVRDDRPETASLYIDGRPSADDVRQGGLPDCFYLALVISVAERDPGRIMRLLPDAGDAAFFSVTFHFRPSRHSTRFIARTVRLPVKLAYRFGTEDVSGAQFRIAPTGVSRWTRMRDGDAEFVREERLYKTALWAPLMEKAYARFAQEHGMYGELFGQSGGGQPAGGYEVIGDAGGSSSLVASVMYGSDLLTQGTVETPAMRGAGEPGLEEPSKELIAALARIDFGGGYGETTHLTAGADARDIGERAVKLAQALLLEDRFPEIVRDALTSLCNAWTPDGEISDDFRAAATALTDPLKFLDEGTVGTDRDVIRRHLELIAGLTPPASETQGLVEAQEKLRPSRAALDDTSTMANTGIDPGEFTLLRQTQEEAFNVKDKDFAARRMVKLINLANTILRSIGSEHALRAHWALRADPRGAALLELALSLRHKGDSSQGQRFTYPSHAYAVLEADFRNAQGVLLEVTPEDVDEFLTEIDTTKSTVRMRNPHHENSPDPGATKSRGTGEFRISLAQFTRQYANVREALVKTR